jgi:preprotein translocase subunit SecG
MNVLFNLVIVVQVISALAIIGLVLLQHGKGADMGAAFGSGASGSLFGASGSSNFLSKSTAFAAAIFFASTLALAYMGNNRTPGAATPSGGVMERMAAPANGVPANAGSTVPGTTTTTTITAPAVAPTAGVPTAPAADVPPAGPAETVPATVSPAPAAQPEPGPAK